MEDELHESPWSLAAGLTDRGVIVTGAASGIGRAACFGFASAGARVFAVDVNSEGLKDTVASLPHRGHTSYTYDLADIRGLEGLVEDAIQDLGQLWALINVAAVLRRQSLEEVSEADWDRQLTVNLKSAFFLDRAVGTRLVEAGEGGRIVNFTSAGFLKGPMAGSHAYVASKGGIVSMTRGFARAYGPHGILCNTVSPGQTDTPMQRNDNPPETLEAVTRSCPLGRMAQPAEIASVAVFLASSHASFINGATINVSGGSVMY